MSLPPSLSPSPLPSPRFQKRLNSPSIGAACSSLMSLDLAANSVWSRAEDESVVINSRGVLLYALKSPKCFSTSDIPRSLDLDDVWRTGTGYLSTSQSVSELEMELLRNDSPAASMILSEMPSNPELKSTSSASQLSFASHVVANVSPLASPRRYSWTMQKSAGPSASLSSYDVMRCVDRKVRKDYINRNLQLTYEKLEEFWQRELKLDKTCDAVESVAVQKKTSDHGSGDGAVGRSGNFLSVPQYRPIGSKMHLMLHSWLTKVLLENALDKEKIETCQRGARQNNM